MGAPWQAGAYVHGLSDCSCQGAVPDNASEPGGHIFSFVLERGRRTLGILTLSLDPEQEGGGK